MIAGVLAEIGTEDLSHTILERYSYISLLGIWLVISEVDLCHFLQPIHATSGQCLQLQRISVGTATSLEIGQPRDRDSISGM
jgi:hypothetical protein